MRGEMMKSDDDCMKEHSDKKRSAAMRKHAGRKMVGMRRATRSTGGKR